MGIDGIGKPGGIPPRPGGVGGPTGRDAIKGESFRVDKGAGPESVTSPDALGQLQRGDITLDQYLDTRVADAVQHLAKKLPPEQLDFVKQSLREQLGSDPVLVALVRRTTGTSPGEPTR